jgi:hypothetical protein
MVAGQANSICLRMASRFTVRNGGKKADLDTINPKLLIKKALRSRQPRI